MKDSITLSGTYADFDRFAILSDSFSFDAFPSADVRRKYYQDYKTLCAMMETHPLTQEFKEIEPMVQEFNATGTPENQKDPERIAQQKILNERIKTLNQKKHETHIESQFSKFAWEKGFKPAYDKESGKVYQSAKALAVIDEWIAKNDEDNNHKKI